MRPKLFALIAVSAVALVGCSAAEPSESPEHSSAAQVSETLAPEANKPRAVAPEKSTNPNERVEQQFVDFAGTRAGAHGVTVDRTQKEIIKSLHDYCDDGKALRVSKAKVLNENLEYIADNTYCEMLK